MLNYIAHRGGSSLMPENSLSAFRNAFELGMSGVELDVHLSRDGHLVVHHDAALNPALVRQAGEFIGRPIPIADLTLAELRKFDVGQLDRTSAYGARFPDQAALDFETLPTLAEVLALAKSYSLADGSPPKLFVEIKTSIVEAMPLMDVERLTRSVVTCLSEHEYLASSYLMAFDWRALDFARSLDQTLALCYTTVPQGWMTGDIPRDHRGLPEKTLQRVAALANEVGLEWLGGTRLAGDSIPSRIAQRGGGYWTPYFQDASVSLIDESVELGVPVIPWTVNRQQDLEQFRRLNVWGVISDHPEHCLK